VDRDQSAIREALEYVESLAPDDVLRTVLLLRDDDWEATGAFGGRHQSFGNVLVEFSKEAARITITRDRSQWMMDLRLEGWGEAFDLDIILDTMADRLDWSKPLDYPLPEQLPAGVSWVEALPQVLGWLAATSNRESTLTERSESDQPVCFHGPGVQAPAPKTDAARPGFGDMPPTTICISGICRLQRILVVIHR